MQNFDILNEYMFPVEEIERALGCLRLLWNRTPGEAGVVSSGKE